MNILEILKLLEGKKTYIISVITAVFNLLLVLGVIEMSPEQIVAMEGVFGSLLSTTIRLGIKK